MAAAPSRTPATPRRAADVIGIPFYVWDLAERFRQDVVDDFVAEYAAGRTPNPCLRCNEKIKFSAVLDKALALGFDAVCTGHYARVRRRPAAACGRRGQGPVLRPRRPDRAAGARTRCSRSVTRRRPTSAREAEARGLAVADKPDSHDICFIADGDTAGFLRDRLGAEPGAVVDTDGVEVGEHDGAYAFTVGQRKGLRIGRPAPDGLPRYVLDVSPVTSTVTVGPAELLDVRRLVGVRPVWSGPAPDVPTGCLAQVRAHGEPVAATAWCDGGSLVVELAEPLRGVAPGQAVVLYDGETVLGSATIDETSPTSGQLPTVPVSTAPARS